MTICQRCGHRNEEGATFCAQCHAFLEWTGSKVPVDQPVSAVAIGLKRHELEVEPGGEAGCEIEVRNQGTIVDECRLTVAGETASWSRVEPSLLRLMPKTSGAARLIFRPPRSPLVPAGPASFTVTAGSTVHPGVTDAAVGTVTVAPFTDLSATLMPQTSESTSSAEHTVAVENQGNAAVRVVIAVNDPNDVLSIDLKTTNLVLEPGQRASSRIRVAARRRGERADGSRRSFQVALLPAQGSRIVLDGAFVPLPRPPSWLMRHRFHVAAAGALGLVALGAVWASAAPHRPWDEPTGPLAVHTPTPAPSAALPPAATATPAIPAPTPPPAAATPSTPVPTARPTPVPVRAARIEAEAQTTQSNVPSLVGPQADCCGVHWSNGQQLFFRSTGAGQYVTVFFDVAQTGGYRVDLRVSRAPDYGMYSMQLDGSTLVTGYQGYVPGTVGSTVVTDTVPLSPGLQLNAGRHSLTLTVTGKHPSSLGYLCGIDYIDLTPT